jgi:hypothetical protein
MIYLMLFSACIAVELSERVNTDNVIKKVGIGFIAVGALVEFAGRDSAFVEIGMLTYFTANICSAYLTKRKRRESDV